MADFGDLNSFIDDYDISFTFNGVEYKETFDFKRVAAFKAYQVDYNDRLIEGEVGAAERRGLPYLAVAKLFGAEFDTSAWEFRKLPKDHFINRMIADGATYEVIDRLVSGIWAKFELGDETAEKFIVAYDLGKALAPSNDTTNPETQQAPGETNEDASETSKA